MKNRQNNLTRRSFLKMVGAGTAATLFAACGGTKVEKLVNSQATDAEDLIPCIGCQRCMPCPYGIDIPGIFQHYNQCKADGCLPEDKNDNRYNENRRNYLISLDRTIPRDRQPDHCIGCGRCIQDDKCPKEIRIPREIQRIGDIIEQAKRG